jgi:hypothetical protein
VGLLGAAAWIFQAWLTAEVVEVYREKRERSIRSHRLASLADAQEFARLGMGGYWRDDVAGLADLPLIDPKLALADVSRGRRKDFQGYWFRSLPFSDEAAPDPKRYAILCFPVRPVGGMYVLTQDRTIWRKAAVAGGIDVFPADPAAEGWQALTK